MPKINLLPKNVAELIAAGEVVERPSSVIKELIENSIDAGATVITVEIQRGGITYMRITDNGCGISFDDVPTAFLRHATSKIKNGEDLDSIATLGFRGEALAAISSVARVDMLTAVEGAESGTHYSIEGGEEVLYEESGCPKGTTIIIKDLFYNTPARMKFLKKDVSEANSCAAVIDRIALSHPEISIKFIRDGKIALNTSGDGDLKSAIYSVLGREFSSNLISVSGENLGISVSGFVCKPVACKPTRNGQYSFLNGRLVRSGTVVAACEQAYKNSAMVGKFPSFVLCLSVPFDMVDVNVHPAKTEVRFSDEKRIFDAVYGAVKNALASGDTRPQVKLNPPAFNRFEHMSAAEYRQQKIDEQPTVAEKVYSKPIGLHNTKETVIRFNQESNFDFLNRISFVAPDGSKTEPMTKEEFNKKYNTQNIEEKSLEVTETTIKEIESPQIEVVPQVEIPQQVVIENKPKPISVDIFVEYEAPEITVIGEVFSTYIVAQMGDSVFMIDKHAAHERILFNELKKNKKTEVQALLTPATVVLSKEEYNAIINNSNLLEDYGFEVDDFGNSTVVVRALPVFLVNEDISSLISEVAAGIITAGVVTTQREEGIMHTVSCRAAIKSGNKISLSEMKDLAEKVLNSKEIMYCPHGRPVAFEIKKRELEKQFGRIQ